MELEGLPRAGGGRRPILTIFFHFNPWAASLGGISTLVRSYVKYAPPSFEVRVVGTAGPSDELGAWQRRELDGRSLRFMPVFRQRRRNTKPWIPDTLRYAVGLRGKRLGSDFMHFHRIEPAIAARRWPGEKTLFVHDDIERQLYTPRDRSETLWGRMPRAYLALERSLIGMFDEVLSCNRASREFHRLRYPELADRFKLIRNCTDPDTHFPLDDEKRNTSRQSLARDMGLPSSTQFVLFAGRLERMKDPETLLRAFAMLECPRAHLLIAGDGSLRKAMERLIADLRLASRVTMLGALPLHDLAGLQRISSVLVLTSAYEGLPLVVLETLACGTPIVTTPSGDTAHVVTSASGIVTEGFEAESIVAALDAVLANPDCFPASACVEAARPFSAEAVVAEVFDRMLERWRQQ